ALLERGDTGLVVRESLDEGGVVVRDELLRCLDAGRVRLGDHLLAGEVLGPGDRLRVLSAHLDRGAGEVVGAGEVDDLETLGGDRVRRDPAVHGPVLDEGLAGLDGGVDVLDLLLAAFAQNVLRQQLGDAGIEAGGLPAGGRGEGEDLVGDGAAADQLVLLLDRGGPGAAGDGVIGSDGAGGDHVGEGRALTAAVGAAAAAEVGAVAGVGAAGGEADEGQGGRGGDDGPAAGAEARGVHGSLRLLRALRAERGSGCAGGAAARASGCAGVSARGSWTGRPWRGRCAGR